MSYRKLREIFRQSYRVLRSVLFSAFLVVVGLYALLYIGSSIPALQNKGKEFAVRELSKLFDSEVEVGSIIFTPFNRVEINGVKLYEPIDSVSGINPINSVSGINRVESKGKQCISIDKVGAGISLWRLLRGEIVVTYAEIIGLDAKIYQPSPGSPLNINFIIKAFEPKDKSKPPTKFSLQIRNIVIRKCNATFDKLWIPRNENPNLIDFNHLAISNLRTDLIINKLSNDGIVVDLRRLAFTERCGLDIEKLSFKGKFLSNSLQLKDLELRLPHSLITYEDFSLDYGSLKDIPKVIASTPHALTINNWQLTPSDFRCFYAPLENLSTPLYLTLNADGDFENLSVEELKITMPNEQLMLNVQGDIYDISDDLKADVDRLKLSIKENYIADILPLIPGLKENVREIVHSLGDVSLDMSGEYSKTVAKAEGEVSVAEGKLSLDAEYLPAHKSLKANVETERFDLMPILPNVGLGEVSFNLDADIAFDSKIPTGYVTAEIPALQYKAAIIEGVTIDAANDGSVATAVISASSRALALDADASLKQAGPDSELSLNLDLENLDAAALGLLGKFPGAKVRGNVHLSTFGNNPDNLQGTLEVNDVLFATDSKNLKLNSLVAKSLIDSDNNQTITLRSDYADVDMQGNFSWAGLVAAAQNIVAGCIPDLVKEPKTIPSASQTASLALTLHPDNGLLEFFNAPVRILVPTRIDAALDSETGTLSLLSNVPYLQQGKNKLVRDISLAALVDRNSGADINASMIWPAKSDVALNVKATGLHDRADIDINWNFLTQEAYKGEVGMTLNAYRSPMSTKRDRLSLSIRPSKFFVNNAEWKVEPATVTYFDNMINVPRLRVWHDSQFVDIRGKASSSPEDILAISLNEVDLGYVFETLNINFVTFSGIATGRVKAYQLLSGIPRATTDGLFVKNFGYNGHRLGEAELTSSWQHEEKRVAIRGDIKDGPKHSAVIDGGVWIGRDSLGFDLDAHGVNAAFIQPFVQNFIADLKGRASGNLTLFGTFKDVDLKGNIKADSLQVKIGYTNVTYSGSDSIIFRPGLIKFPGFHLRDKFGNKAVFSGTVKHSFFRDAFIDLKVRNAKHILAFDTNPTINPNWYGTVFGTGNVSITGNPRETRLLIDMQTDPGSDFTFVLNNNAAANDYTFLTFSDKKKETYMKEHPVDTVPTFIETFKKKVNREQTSSSAFRLDLRGTITPDAKVTLVMDPVAGDKITGEGQGALQLGYDGESDEVTLAGTYTIDKGVYNFSLQDLILKDFIIKSGSKITFNGDPMAANLDITAAYRVNTNLADLDKSFSQDKELNRTNVPVDAILHVDGPLTTPEISFDIDLPTLTNDVSRKVKSIISTDDMMNRQIIYLLALNRFYTPEYMGATGNGGELASMASATVSSQIRNMLGQLTDKFAIAPSIRTDKGNFSDLEMDLALSSSLLNNRLLVNGNFGYRDRSTSTTTFVGDFDIEYLLNRSGNVRLKAYNHYNDQNYYLKSSLTTQGIGILYRRDFERPIRQSIRQSIQSLQSLGNSFRRPESPSDSIPTKSKK